MNAGGKLTRGLHDHVGDSIRVRFKAATNICTPEVTASGGGIIHAVYASMHDSCTWQRVEVGKDGTFTVDFELRVRNPSEDTHLHFLDEFGLNRRLKLHFFSNSGKDEVFLCAGHWPIKDILLGACAVNGVIPPSLQAAPTRHPPKNAQIGKQARQGQNVRTAAGEDVVVAPPATIVGPGAVSGPGQKGGPPGIVVDGRIEVKTTYECAHNFEKHGIVFELIKSDHSAADIAEGYEQYRKLENRGRIASCPLDESDEMNGAIEQQIKHTGENIKKHFECNQATGDHMFYMPGTMYSMQGQITHLTNIFMNTVQNVHQFTPVPLTLYNITAALKLNKLHGADGLSEDDMAHVFADVLTVHALDSHASPYISDETLGLLIPMNGCIVAQATQSERVSRSYAFPVRLDGSINCDDCEGKSDFMASHVKGISMLGEMTKNMDGDRLKAFAEKYDDEIIKNLTTEQRVRLIKLNNYFYDRLVAGHFQVFNVLGTAMGASADKNTRQLGGHSYAVLEVHDGASAGQWKLGLAPAAGADSPEDSGWDKPRISRRQTLADAILLEGTSYLRQLSESVEGRLSAELNVKAKQSQVDSLSKMGFTAIAGADEKGDIPMSMHMDPETLVGMAAASNVLSSTNPEMRVQMPFVPHGKAMRKGIVSKAIASARAAEGEGTIDGDMSFYQQMYCTGWDMVVEEKGQSMLDAAQQALALAYEHKPKFGTKFAGYAQNENVKFVRPSGKPLSEEMQERVNRFIVRRSRAMHMPLVDHKDIMATVNKFWSPIEYPSLSPAAGPQTPLEAMTKYVHVSSSVPYEVQDRRSALDDAKSVVEKFNTRNALEKTGHVATSWACMTGVVRTLSLRLDTIKDVTISDSEGIMRSQTNTAMSQAMANASLTSKAKASTRKKR